MPNVVILALFWYVGIKEQIENIILSSISPLLPEFRIKPIVFQNEDGTDRLLIIVYVAESWTGPHMVTIGRENRYWTRHNFQSGPIVMDEREVRERYERNLRLFGALDEYMSSITGVLSLGGMRYTPLKDHGLLLVLAAPVLLTPDRVDISDTELRSWVEWYGNNPWNSSAIQPFFKPSLRGLLYEGHELKWPGTAGYVKARIEIHTNGLVEYARGIEQRVGYPTICSSVVRLVCFVAKFYEHLKYYGPVRLLFRIENANKPTFDILAARGPRDHTYVEPVLGFHFDISGADLITHPIGAVSQVLDTFYRAFGEERYPVGVLEKAYGEIAAPLGMPLANQQE